MRCPQWLLLFLLAFLLMGVLRVKLDGKWHKFLVVFNRSLADMMDARIFGPPLVTFTFWDILDVNSWNAS